MKKIIDNIKFEEIKYSCGYGAINNVLNNYGYLLNEHKVYFLCGGFNFEFLEQTGHIGYSNLFNTYKILSKICEVSYLNKKIDYTFIEEKIKNSIDKDEMILIYVTNKALKHHNLKAPVYPFHMLIIYGYDTDKSTLEVADLYIITETGEKQSFIGAIDKDILLSNMVDCIFIKRLHTKNIKPTKIICDNIKEYYQSQYIDSLYYFIKNIKINFQKDIEQYCNQFPNFIIPAKWNIFIPFFNSSIQLCKEFNLFKLEEKFSNVYLHINSIILQMIKMGYKKNISKILEYINIFEEYWRKAIGLLECLRNILEEKNDNE